MNAEEMRKILGPLLNEFGEHQWRCGRGIPGAHEDLESSFEAVISAACAAARTEELRVLREVLMEVHYQLSADHECGEPSFMKKVRAALEQTK